MRSAHAGRTEGYKCPDKRLPVKFHLVSSYEDRQVRLRHQDRPAELQADHKQGRVEICLLTAARVSSAPSLVMVS